MIYVLNFRDQIPNTHKTINTTTKSSGWSRNLSPMLVGPVVANGIECKNIENAWQFSKVYEQHVNSNQEPTEEYFAWRNKGYQDSWAHRYPMGKGSKPLFSLWNGQKLDYIEARKQIYIPLYASSVVKTEAFSTLKKIYDSNQNLVLLDYDAYNHRLLNMTWDTVINNPNKKMGHAFVLAMLLEGYING